MVFGKISVTIARTKMRRCAQKKGPTMDWWLFAQSMIGPVRT
jgi:hypothetical protein